MRKRLISGLMVTVIITGFSYEAVGTPNTSNIDANNEKVDDAREQYNTVTKRIKDLESKVDELSMKMEPVFFEVEYNKEKIKEIEGKVTTTNKEVEEAQKEINDKQKILDERVRASYKSGNRVNYLTMILSSGNFGEFLSNIDSISRVVRLDREVITNLDKKKESLNGSINLLNDQKNEISELNKATEEKLKELEDFKKKEEHLLQEVKKEKERIGGTIGKLERGLVESYIDAAKSSGSNKDQLNEAITTLISMKPDLISDELIKEVEEAIEIAKNNLKKIESTQITYGSNDGNPGEGGNFYNPNEALPSGKAQELINYAKQFLGKPYILGATGPNAFDCSGLVQYVFRKFGYNLTRVTFTQVNEGIPISRNELIPGDLVFTEGPASRPGHVGIYVGNGKMLHAANPRKGVIIGPIYNYSTARRILK